MKKTILRLGSLLFALMAVLPFTASGGPAAPEISAENALTALHSRDAGQPYVFLDVRTREEFDERHIPGAILLPYTEIKERENFYL